MAVLLLANTAALVSYARHYPFYSHMKSSYLLVSLPAGLALVGLGYDRIRRWRPLGAVSIGAIGLLALLSTVHVLRIVTALAAQ